MMLAFFITVVPPPDKAYLARQLLSAKLSEFKNNEVCVVKGTSLI